MITQFFQEFFTTLISERMASVLSEPMAIFTVLMLCFLLFSLFCGKANKKVFIVSICVLTLIICVYMFADSFGFVTLPVKMVA